MLRLWKSAPAPDHEELFVKYYEQLLLWSLQLTGHDRLNAEDLVHDVFIQFTITQPALSEIENLEGYLFAMLRNLLRSQRRREMRGFGSPTSLVDYDSAEIGLRFVDPRQQLPVRDELRAICHYASARKETSKSGSALLLRYFLGYYPSEIALITRSSNQAVDFLLSSARREARLYLSQPQRLSFMKEQSPPPPAQVNPETVMDDFLGELAREIFQSCQGTCPTTKSLRALYQEAGSKATETRTLAHIVSCPRCLDAVNQILKLPPLSERYPTDTLGPERRDRNDKDDSGGSHSGSGSGDGSAPNTVKKFRRRLREIIEHEPKELRVALNGQLLGTLTVSAELNKLNLHIEETEKIGFIEVFSEQGLRLFFLNVAPPPEGSFEQEARAAFSNQRALQVSVNFNGPSADLQVVYQNPAAVESAAAPILSEAGDSSVGDEEENRLPRFLAALGSLRSRLFDLRFWLRPGVVTAALAVILIVSLLIFRLPGTRVSASELLHRTAVAESRYAGREDSALHRTLSLEESDPAGGQVLSRRRIEIWQSAAKGIKVRRLYDEQNQLIAGEWQQPDGSRTIYQNRAASQPGEDSIRNPQSAIRNLAVWQVEPAADAFASLVEHSQTAVVQEQPATWTISYEADASQNQNGLARTVLVIDRASLRAIEQTLTLGLDGQARVFRIAETGIERPPLEKVAPNVFVPEPELLGKETEAREAKHPEKIATLPPSAAAAPPVRTTPIMATPELEVTVLHLLNKVGATLGEEVSVRRTVDGMLLVEGVVENAQRKTAILSALDSVAGNPAVRLQIETPEEAQKRAAQQARGSSGPVVIQQAVPSGGTIPVYAEVRRYLLKSGTPEVSIDAQVNQFANRAVNRSRQVMLHVWALRRLVQRFTPEEVRRFDQSARDKWLEMIREHARGCQRETSSLRQELTAVFNPEAAAAETVNDINDDEALTRAILRLIELSTTNDEAIRSAFTLSAPGQTVAIKGSPFWRSLNSAEKLATKIAAGR